MGTVYVVTNMINGKKYVGKTIVSTAARWRQHRSNARSGVNAYLYKAMRKHGAGNFTIEVVDSALLAEEVEAKEIEWIAKLGTTDPTKGYNCTTGGDSGLHTGMSRNHAKRVVSVETRAKLSAAKKGKALSPEHQAKCKYGRLGKKQTQEEKDKRAETLRRFWDEHPERRIANGLKAQEPTPDGRIKMGEASRRRWATPEGRAEASARIKQWWADHAEARDAISKRVWTEESRAKARAASMKRWRSISLKGG